MAISEKDIDQAKTQIAKAIKAASNLGISETDLRRTAESAINALRG